MPGSDITYALIWDVLWKTAFVLAILYGVMWAVRRFSGRPLLAKRGLSISVVETAHLGPNRSVHLVGVGNKLLLLGATTQQISVLAELESADIDRSADELRVDQGFDRYLNQAKNLMASISAIARPKEQLAISKDADRPEVDR